MGLVTSVISKVLAKSNRLERVKVFSYLRRWKHIDEISIFIVNKIGRNNAVLWNDVQLDAFSKYRIGHHCHFHEKLERAIFHRKLVLVRPSSYTVKYIVKYRFSADFLWRGCKERINRCRSSEFRRESSYIFTIWNIEFLRKVFLKWLNNNIILNNNRYHNGGKIMCIVFFFIFIFFPWVQNNTILCYSKLSGCY